MVSKAYVEVFAKKTCGGEFKSHLKYLFQFLNPFPEYINMSVAYVYSLHLATYLPNP